MVEATELNKNVDESLISEMMEAGLHYGHTRTKTNPKMKPFIATTRNNVELIDLNQTISALEKVISFLKDKRANSGLVLFVGIQPAARELIESLAKKLEYPYVTNRWLGGTLTNFKIIQKRLDYFKKLRNDKETGALEKYTKKERLRLGQKLEKMSLVFNGLESLTKLPDAVFVVNANLHINAVREARKLGIPVIGIVSTDIDPNVVDFVVPANDNSKSSLAWILNKVEKELSSVAPIVKKSEEKE